MHSVNRVKGYTKHLCPPVIKLVLQYRTRKFDDISVPVDEVGPCLVQL
jgi:hypothetical protein